MAPPRGMMKRMALLLALLFATSVRGLLRQAPRMDSATTSLQGYSNFVRTNPKSDKVSVQKFHHVEFYCGDARNTYSRFLVGLGMEMLAKSDQSTGNSAHCSYLLKSGDMQMLFTAAYPAVVNGTAASGAALPGFCPESLQSFCIKHGLGVRAVAVEVEDVEASFRTVVQNGGQAVLTPLTLADKHGLGEVDLAEVALYGDVVLRFVDSRRFRGDFLPNFEAAKQKRRASTFGLKRFDHIVGNLWSLQPTMDRIKGMTGFHDFAEFVADDVGTVDSGLNSVVLANNNEMVLLPLNEPTFGTKRKSQIQTYLEQNNGEGVQHMALFTADIFDTMTKMRQVSDLGGFEFMDPPGSEYYRNVRKRLGDALTEEQYQRVEELGLLADKDDQGVLLQVFTKPVGDRATLFLEVIQRIGCLLDGAQKPGCGGFGKGNFKDLFKSIEDYEAKLKLN